MSYQPSPAVDTSFLNELAVLMHSQERPDPFVARTFRAKAEQLLKTSKPQMVWVARAAVAAYEWNVAEVLDIARRGRQAVGNNPDVLVNLAVSLEHVGEIEAAHEFARDAALALPLDPFCLHHRVGTLAGLGRWCEALDVAQEFVSRVGEAHSATELKTAEQLQAWLEMLKATGVREQQVQIELAQAWQVFRELRVRQEAQTVFYEKSPYGGLGTVAIRLTFRGDIDQEIRLGAALAPRLAKLDGWDPTKLSVDFECVQLEDANTTV